MPIPDYQAILGAYHTAFRRELATLTAVLPVQSGAQMVEVGSGDGFFAGLLADRMSRSGTLTCVDASQDFLALARAHLRRHPRAKQIAFERGDVRSLPFPGGRFDFAWCAQSLYSFPSVVNSVREMGRVLR